MDISGSKPNATDGNTARQNDGFVHHFKERLCFSCACGSINQPKSTIENSSHTKSIASMDSSGFKSNSKEKSTARQTNVLLAFSKRVRTFLAAVEPSITKNSPLKSRLGPNQSLQWTSPALNQTTKRETQPNKTRDLFMV
uniref:Uncharacterized protein n=1 Tax=Panagrellus redivivus TaxID=6233 RepID=A0A7E4UP00_PANRE